MQGRCVLANAEAVGLPKTLALSTLLSLNFGSGKSTEFGRSRRSRSRSRGRGLSTCGRSSSSEKRGSSKKKEGRTDKASLRLLSMIQEEPTFETLQEVVGKNFGEERARKAFSALKAADRTLYDKIKEQAPEMLKSVGKLFKANGDLIEPINPLRANTANSKTTVTCDRARALLLSGLLGLTKADGGTCGSTGDGAPLWNFKNNWCAGNTWRLRVFFTCCTQKTTGSFTISHVRAPANLNIQSGLPIPPTHVHEIGHSAIGQDAAGTVVSTLR